MSDNFWNDETVQDFVQYHMELLPTSYIGQIKNMMRDYKKEHTPVSVVEKDYEILQFRSNLKKGYSWALQPDGKYINSDECFGWSFERLVGIGYDGSAYHTVKNGQISIHSVRRLSDEYVFRVGDYCVQGEIKRFVLSNWSGNITAVFESGDKGCEIYLNDLQMAAPPKKILGTTQDGKVCYEGDDFPIYVVDQDFKSWKVLSPNGVWANDWKYFFDKDKCLQYIQENKPITVSYKELSKDFSKFGIYTHESVLAYLKEFFKSKINQP